MTTDPLSNSQPIVRVAVAGAAGRMGRHVVRAIYEDPWCELSAAVDVHSVGEDAGELAGLPAAGVTIWSELRPALVSTGTQVLVDFTRAQAAYENAFIALEVGVSPVIGTTGMSLEQLGVLRRKAEELGVGAFMAPNFAIGAVLLMLFSRQAARYLPDVEVIELHHEQKVDAPSGTALRTIEMILEGRGEGRVRRPATEELKVPGARGGEINGVRVHSVRLPGFVAHQECIFGGLGQTLTLRHDSLDRASFMPGVILACRKVRSLQGLVVGLEHLLEQ
jgi:4-hydroxy-tetrahydrodipicolinate reductase